MRKGFTLAEVLITLGIIGVVAAITLPTVISKFNTAKKRNILKKTVSEINQAYAMVKAKEGYDVDFFAMSATPCSLSTIEADGVNPCAVLNSQISGISFIGSSWYGGALIKLPSGVNMLASSEYISRSGVNATSNTFLIFPVKNLSSSRLYNGYDNKNMCTDFNNQQYANGVQWYKNCDEADSYQFYVDRKKGVLVPANDAVRDFLYGK